MSETNHVITHDQIDKVWRYVKCNHSAQTWDALLTVLAGFGISRCEECGGTGVHRSWDFHPNEKPHEGQTCSACEKCNYHGWVIHDKN